LTDDDRLDEILGDWRARRDAGEAVDPETFVRAHPEHAETLRACFAAMRLVPDALDLPGSAAGPALRAMPEGRYAGFRVSGEGGMGIVYWAIDSDLGREVAFKVVRPRVGEAPVETPQQPLALTPPVTATPESSTFDSLKARFLREARITAALEHPGIVPVYELGETPEGVPYYTMRFVRGNRTLAHALAETPMDQRLRLLDPFLKVCDTLRYAHARGVIHRDLKPANVALGEYGEVVVLDWGLAREHGRADEAHVAADAASLPTTPRTAIGPVGTPGYMSPEAARGRPDELDRRTDVYSLGAILFEILTGRLPFQRARFDELLHDLSNVDPPDPAEVAPSAPKDLARICRRALARDPDARFQSVDEFAAAVRDWQTRSAREAQIAAGRSKAAEGVAIARRLGRETPILELAAASHACRDVLELVPDDPEMTAFTAELTKIHEEVVAKQIQLVRGRVLRRAAIVALAVASVATTVVAVAMNSARRGGEDALVELARKYSAEAAAASDPATARRNVERALDCLDAAKTAGGRLDADVLAAPDFAPLADEPRFRALSGGR
jgi:hypothetical protein